jgi:hypothetical protein
MMIYLVGTSILCFGLLTMYRVLTEKPKMEDMGKGLVTLLLEPPAGGFPFIFPIAMAFVAALIL